MGARAENWPISEQAASRMTRTILYDGFHLTGGGGSGIATYARQLIGAVRLNGDKADAVLGSGQRADPRNPLLSLVGVFDPVQEKPQGRLRRLANYLQAFPGAPFGINTVKMPVAGHDNGGALAGIEDAYIGKRTFDRARAHFVRYGRFARVKIATGPSLFHATFPLPVRLPGIPNVVTIHDLIPLRLPSASLDDKRYFHAMVKAAAHSADHVVTVSEHSKRDIVEILGVPEDKVTNTHQPNGLPEWAMQISDAEVARDVRQGFGLEPKDYFLFFGTLEPKKNVGRLIEAFALSGSKRQLIIVGGLGWDYESDLARIDDERFISIKGSAAGEPPRFTIDRRVRRIPYASYDTLVSLIKGARALLFPSLYEGFGLPVLEAMSIGTPVMTANSTSLPEIVGDAGILVNPYDVKAMSYAIETLDRDDLLAQDLGQRASERAKLFSREAYAARIGALYDRILK